MRYWNVGGVTVRQRNKRITLREGTKGAILRESTKSGDGRERDISYLHSIMGTNTRYAPGMVDKINAVQLKPLVPISE